MTAGSPELHPEGPRSDAAAPPETPPEEARDKAREFLEVAESSDLWDDAD